MSSLERFHPVADHINVGPYIETLWISKSWKDFLNLDSMGWVRGCREFLNELFDVYSGLSVGDSRDPREIFDDFKGRLREFTAFVETFQPSNNGERLAMDYVQKECSERKDHIHFVDELLFGEGGKNAQVIRAMASLMFLRQKANEETYGISSGEALQAVKVAAIRVALAITPNSK